MSAAKFREYAAEHLDWAKTAKSHQGAADVPANGRGLAGGCCATGHAARIRRRHGLFNRENLRRVVLAQAAPASAAGGPDTVQFRRTSARVNMLIRPFLSGQAFDPETIDKMAEALKSVCDTLSLKVVTMPQRASLPGKSSSVRDVAALRAMTLKEISRSNSPETARRGVPNK